jgi:penicillin-binding protein-related factor A (putative recombinase)
MRDEAEVCNIICKSLVNCYKIPDPTSNFSQTIFRPFDLLGSFDGKPLYIEAKHRKGLLSLNLKDIKDHQIDALMRFKNEIPNALCWIIWGVTTGKHGDNRFYIFTDIFEINRRRNAKDNIKKKELENLPYLKLFKGVVDFSSLAESPNTNIPAS